MPSIVLFTQEWYGNMISQVLDDNREASPDAKAQATAAMVAGAFIAEAIAHAFEEQRDTMTVVTHLEDLAAAAERIAEAMQSK